MTPDWITTLGSTILMVFFPIAMLIIVVIFLIVTIWLTPKIIRGLPRLIARLRGLFGSDPQASASR